MVAEPLIFLNVLFFFQAEDGIRDVTVTGVQTCALPILYVSPLIDAHGQHTGWMSSMTDITEPNRIREQLSASYERFTIVLEALDASVSVAPLGSAELLFANKLYRQWFEIGRAHV